MDRQQSWSFAGLPPEEPQAGVGSSSSASTANPLLQHENTDVRRRETDPPTPTPTEPSSQRARSYAEKMRDKARKCWICHDEELPEYVPVGLMGRRRRKIYRSRDPALGRLLSPCLCKNSVGYVHEGCIREYRNHQPDAYTCARCGYAYQLERLTWAQRLRSPLAAAGLTAAILLAAVFLLGFFADPILNLWLDPADTFASVFRLRRTPEVKLEVRELGDGDGDGADGWLEHLLKGVLSLGLLGFVKSFLVMSPWQWWNLRTSGIMGGVGRRRGTGRDRVEDISLAMVVIGVVTFLYAVWKGTRAWTERTLERASEKIMNARPDDDEYSDGDGEDDAQREGAEDAPAGDDANGGDDDDDDN